MATASPEATDIEILPREAADVCPSCIAATGPRTAQCLPDCPYSGRKTSPTTSRGRMTANKGPADQGLYVVDASVREPLTGRLACHQRRCLDGRLLVD